MDSIKDPADLRALSIKELDELAGQIRHFLVAKVCAAGGHLGVNLGVVELTLALHRVFDSPHDVLLFDTGHQAYVHKILTGRAARFDTLRQDGGLSGYPARAESPHDWIENSHASTALSYADGIAKAFHLRHELPGQTNGIGHGDRHVVAVIGDGALTGGLAWEGLNNLAVASDRPLIVVVNDNGRSYAPTIGGIAQHLSRLRDRHTGIRASTDPAVDTSLFDQLGLTYLGPIDGHDIAALEPALRHAAMLQRTVVVHVVTDKGRGYAPAEADEADHMHGVGATDPASGRPRTTGEPTWTSVFSQEITQLAERRPDLVAVTAAMLQPVGLKSFAQKFPGRVFDVGIAEQQAVCSAAGLAMGGLHPVVCIYATFLNRAFDQILMDVALHRLGVTFILDRAGITGPDGPSHHGIWDLSTLAVVPGLRLAAPRDPARLGELLNEAVDISDCPTVIRFPKASAGTDLDAMTRMDGIDIMYRSKRLPTDVLLVAIGATAPAALDAAGRLNARGIGVTVIDPRWVLPIHPTMIHLAARHRLVITLEEGARIGGAGACIGQACADNDVATPIRNLGLPHEFIEHGERQRLLRRTGLTADAIAHTALRTLFPPASFHPAAIPASRYLTFEKDAGDVSLNELLTFRKKSSQPRQHYPPTVPSW